MRRRAGCRAGARSPRRYARCRASRRRVRRRSSRCAAAAGASASACEGDPEREVTTTFFRVRDAGLPRDDGRQAARRPPVHGGRPSRRPARRGRRRSSSTKRSRRSTSRARTRSAVASRRASAAGRASIGVVDDVAEGELTDERGAGALHAARDAAVRRPAAQALVFRTTRARCGGAARRRAQAACSASRRASPCSRSTTMERVFDHRGRSGAAGHDAARDPLGARARARRGRRLRRDLALRRPAQPRLGRPHRARHDAGAAWFA